MSDVAEVPDVEVIPAGTVLQGRYRIIRTLGIGGMGTVYEAENTTIEKRVALKCLHPQLVAIENVVARFHQEAMAATRIGHENIIDVTDFGRLDDGTVFMAMEYLEGSDFAEIIFDEGPQPVGRTAHILAQVCDALAAAHEKGVVHRDLKPENLFITQRHRDPYFVKLLDFGISKFVNAADKIANKLTKAGDTLGTPWYMSPEQIQGDSNIDHRTDIYALGVILFNALTGRHPFEDDSFAKIAVDVCTKVPVEVSALRPDVPDALVSLCKRLLAKDAADRPQSCAEVAEALIPFMDHDGPIGSLPPGHSSGGMRGLRPTALGHTAHQSAQPTPIRTESGVRAAGRPSATAFEEKVRTENRRLPPKAIGLAVAAAALITLGAYWDDLMVASDSPPEAPPATLQSAPLAPEATEPSPTAPPANPVEQLVEILVSPSGATLFHGETSLGLAPMQIARPVTEGEELEVDIRLEGYEMETLTLTHQTAGVVRVELHPEAESSRERESSRRRDEPEAPPGASPDEAPLLMPLPTRPSRSRRSRSGSMAMGSMRGSTFMIGEPINPWAR